MLTWSRIAASFLIVGFAAQGRATTSGVLLIAAALTDAIDGRIARATGTEAGFGRRLDASADALLLLAVTAAVLLTKPPLGRDGALLLGGFGALWLLSLATPPVVGRPVVAGGPASKAGGAMLYCFALLILLSGTYNPVMLTLPAAGLGLSALETFVRCFGPRMPAATSIIQASGRASRHRSQSPHSLKEVVSSPKPTISTVTSATATTSEMRP